MRDVSTRRVPAMTRTDRTQQRAYQIRVEPDGAGHAAAWDSGQVESARSADIPYDGRPLARGRRYTWQVRVWDEAPTSSGWSQPACFEVELDPVSGWRAAWIGLQRIPDRFTDPGQHDRHDRVVRALSPAPYLRRAFHVAGPVAWARLYITALGLYEARLNGGRVGDAFWLRAEIPPGATASVHVASGDAAEVRDVSGRGPAAIASFPGAAGVQEAVFEVGPGVHEFSGAFYELL
jgi:alpha-L-rhamnosidase